MKPWSWGSLACWAPEATAFFTISSTAGLVGHDMAIKPSVYFEVSHSSRFVKVRKNDSESNITKACSLMIMHAAFSSENLGLKEKPRAEKNSIDFLRSRTARL